MLDRRVFNRLFLQFAANFPSSLKEGRVPVAVEHSYYATLGECHTEHLASAFKRLASRDSVYLPSAGVIMAAAKCIAKASARPQGEEAPSDNHQLTSYAGRRLPDSAADIPVDASRSPELFGVVAQNMTTEWLGKIKQMLQAQGQ